MERQTFFAIHPFLSNQFLSNQFLSNQFLSNQFLSKLAAGVGIAVLLTLTPIGLSAQSTNPATGTQTDQTNQAGTSMDQMSDQTSGQQSGLITDPTRISGSTINPFQQSYFTVVPKTNDSEVTLVMDITSGGNEDSGETTFFVFSPGGLETLRAGTRPEYTNVAAGTVTSQGAYRDKLSATFRIVGNTPYTVLVVNRTNQTATYDLRVIEGSFRR